jgi:antitoxin component of MazEF toxin-antitoxin module
MTKPMEIAMSVKLLKWGHGVGLLIPAFAARSCGFKPGSFVRIIVLENEIRVRPVSSPRVDDLESLEEYQERQAKAECTPRW